MTAASSTSSSSSLSVSEADRLLADQPELLARARAIRDSGEYRIGPQHRGAGQQEEHLTARNIEILVGIADGDTDREIAADLCVAVSTIQSTVKRILRILGARNRTHAVTIGFQQGLLSTTTEGNPCNEASRSSSSA